ncbi:stage III sporulation protein AF [Clostridium lundense]|uniref:stage III sporulation protein AF n=1 Tax=Clostridium lundense TaxID=319475 RepID=UPI00048A144A|nr:stage III sporulation protein AF [Clostridium lundense]
MLESLKGWVINICTIVLFITAVEMILPDNSLKKYSKFALGLILISVLINPLIKIFDKNFDINVYSNNISKAMDEEKYKNTIQEYRGKTLENTINNFQANLKGMIEEKIKDKFPDLNTTVDVKAEFDDKENKFNIKNINVGIKDKKVKKVKKVQVNSSEKGNEDNILKDQLSNNIKEYLSKELGVQKNIITIYKI